MAFHSFYNSKPVTYFDWIDYRGGILTEITDIPDSNDTSEITKSEISDLASHIELSNAVILVVDAFVLTYYSNIKRHGTGRAPAGSMRYSRPTAGYIPTGI